MINWCVLMNAKQTVSWNWEVDYRRCSEKLQWLPHISKIAFMLYPDLLISHWAGIIDAISLFMCSTCQQVLMKGQCLILLKWCSIYRQSTDEEPNKDYSCRVLTKHATQDLDRTKNNIIELQWQYITNGAFQDITPALMCPSVRSWALAGS